MTAARELIIEPSNGKKADACVILLHGLGADGHDFEPLVPALALPESLAVRFVLPHAPQLPVTVNGGMTMSAWYDILEMNLGRRVDVEQLRASAERVHGLVEDQVADGIDSRRIVIAGFSQGGAVAYEAALSCARPLAGLLALSTYFATADSIDLATPTAACPSKCTTARPIRSSPNLWDARALGRSSRWVTRSTTAPTRWAQPVSRAGARHRRLVGRDISMTRVS